MDMIISSCILGSCLVMNGYLISRAICYYADIYKPKTIDNIVENYIRNKVEDF
jgi:hypothetical protein